MTAYQPGAPQPAEVYPSGVVEFDAPCRKCGYNVRGLPLVGRCPECGTLVGLSTQGDLLRYSEPRWLAALARGARFIVWGVATIFLGAIAMAILIGVSAARPGGARVPLVVMGLALVAGYVMLIIGWWLLTTPDPSGLGEDRYGTSRKVIRVALLIGLGNQLLSIAQAAFTVPPDVRIALTLVDILAAIAGVIGIIAQLQYLGKLALRLPDHQLAGRAETIKWGLGITYSFFAVLGAVGELIGRQGGGAGGGAALGVFGCVGGIAGLVMLVFFFMYLRLLERLGKAFREQAGLAQQTWSDAPPVPAGT